MPINEKMLKNPEVRNSVKGYIKSVHNVLPQLYTELSQFTKGLSVLRSKYPDVENYTKAFERERGFLSKYKRMETLKNAIKTLIKVQGLSQVADREVERSLHLLRAEAVKLELAKDVSTQLLMFCITAGASTALSALKNSPKVVELAVLLRHQQIYRKFLSILQNNQGLLKQILTAVQTIDLGSTGIQIINKIRALT